MGKSQVAASYCTHEGDFDSPEVTEVIEVFCFLLDGGSMSLPGQREEGKVEGVLVASLGFEDTEDSRTNFELVPVIDTATVRVRPPFC